MSVTASLCSTRRQSSRRHQTGFTRSRGERGLGRRRRGCRPHLHRADRVRILQVPVANHADIEAAVLAVEVLGRGGLPQRTDQVHVGVRSQRGVFVGDAEPGEARTQCGGRVGQPTRREGIPKFVYVVWAESGVPQELTRSSPSDEDPFGIERFEPGVRRTKWPGCCFCCWR